MDGAPGLSRTRDGFTRRGRGGATVGHARRLVESTERADGSLRRTIKHCWGRGWRGAVRLGCELDPEGRALRAFSSLACSQFPPCPLRSLGAPRVNLTASTAPNSVSLPSADLSRRSLGTAPE